MAIDETGREIVGYRLVELMGRGGMASVWLAEHSQLTHKRVAIKLLDPVLARDPELVERFRKEAQIQARLQHPNIVAIENISEDGLAMVLELVEGKPLDDLIGREIGPIPHERALPLMLQILDAVAYAHERGVVHRDLKPSNIIVTPEGHVKVMDFGIAKILGGAKLTATGASLGTPAYMAPEQIRGARDVDARADIYSLGVTFYEMLAGRTPFESPEGDDTDFALRLAHVQQAPPDPRSFYPAIPDRLVAVVLKALEKEPAARFQTAAELRAAVVDDGDAEATKVLAVSQPAPPPPLLVPAEVGPVTAPAEATAPSLSQPRRRPLVLWATVAAVALLAVGVLLAALPGADPAAAAPDPGGPTAAAPEPGGTAAAAPEPGPGAVPEPGRVTAQTPPGGPEAAPTRPTARPAAEPSLVEAVADRTAPPAAPPAGTRGTAEPPQPTRVAAPVQERGFTPAGYEPVSASAVRQARELNNKGFRLYRKGRNADALRYYLRALRTNPNIPYYWYNAACIYAMQGDAARAIEHLEGFARRLAPDRVERARVKVRVDTDLDRIRGDQRFRDFVWRLDQ